MPIFTKKKKKDTHRVNILYMIILNIQQISGKSILKNQGLQIAP